MKKNKLLIGALSVLTVVSLASCGNDSSDTAKDDNNYYVTVKYENGTPVTGVSVQWCTLTMCYQTVEVNSQGTAAFLPIPEDNENYVHLYEDSIPEGYTYQPNNLVNSATNKSLEIVLHPISNPTGTGTKNDAYNVGSGYFENITASKTDIGTYTYYNFTPEAPGTYVVESHAVMLLAQVKLDPAFGYYGSDTTFTTGVATDDNGARKNAQDTHEYNFKYEITVPESDFTNGALNSTAKYCFAIRNKDLSNNIWPASYAFSILKK